MKVDLIKFLTVTEDSRQELLDIIGDDCECATCDFAPGFCSTAKLLEKLKDPESNVVDAFNEFMKDTAFMNEPHIGGVQ